MSETGSMHWGHKMGYYSRAINYCIRAPKSYVLFTFTDLGQTGSFHERSQMSLMSASCCQWQGDLKMHFVEDVCFPPLV